MKRYTYVVEKLVPFKGWQPLSSKPRTHLGVAADEFSAYVRTEGDEFNIRLRNDQTGRILKSHKKPTATKEKKSA